MGIYHPSTGIRAPVFWEQFMVHAKIEARIISLCYLVRKPLVIKSQEILD